MRQRRTAFAPYASSLAFPEFFFHHGFRVVEDRAALPDKIYKDCQTCPRLYKCDEVAMVRGQVPKVSILGPKIDAEQLIKISV